MIKIKLFGSDREQDQIPLIRKGFTKISNCELVKDTRADLIYSNDSGGYDEAIEYQNKFGGKLILNVLDIPEHLFPDFNLEKLKSKLIYANSITCISKTVQNQINKYLNLESTVIYNPSKEVYQITELYQYSGYLKFLHIGRRIDPNKRYSLVVELIRKYYQDEQLLNIGQDPGIGKYTGLIKDKYLAPLYNHCDYILVFTKNGGIELPVIEALICGKIPIVLNDCECCMEFCPEFSCDPNSDAIYQKIQEIENNKESYLKIVKKYQDQYLEQFHYNTIVQNILKVYNSL